MKTMLATLALVFCLASPALTAQTPASYLPRELVATVQLAKAGYSGNVKTRKYHNSECKFFNCRTCTVFFKSAKEAKSAGYSPCQKCGG